MHGRLALVPAAEARPSKARACSKEQAGRNARAAAAQQRKGVGLTAASAGARWDKNWERARGYLELVRLLGGEDHGGADVSAGDGQRSVLLALCMSFQSKPCHTRTRMSARGPPPFPQSRSKLGAGQGR